MSGDMTEPAILTTYAPVEDEEALLRLLGALPPGTATEARALPAGGLPVMYVYRGRALMWSLGESGGAGLSLGLDADQKPGRLAARCTHRRERGLSGGIRLSPRTELLRNQENTLTM
jgi:hypothetical protein